MVTPVGNRLSPAPKTVAIQGLFRIVPPPVCAEDRGASSGSPEPLEKHWGAFAPQCIVHVAFRPGLPGALAATIGAALASAGLALAGALVAAATARCLCLGADATIGAALASATLALTGTLAAAATARGLGSSGVARTPAARAAAVRALALTSIAAPTAITLAASSVVDADVGGHEGNEGECRPKNQAVHEKTPCRKESNHRHRTATRGTDVHPCFSDRSGGQRHVLVQFSHTPSTIRGGRYGISRLSSMMRRTNSAVGLMVTS